MNHYSNGPKSQDGATYTSWTTMTKIKRWCGLAEIYKHSG